MPEGMYLTSKQKLNASLGARLDMERLKHDRLYFLQQYTDGHIGKSFNFTEAHNEWLTNRFGNNWYESLLQKGIHVKIARA